MIFAHSTSFSNNLYSFTPTTVLKALWGRSFCLNHLWIFTLGTLYMYLLTWIEIPWFKLYLITEVQSLGRELFKWSYLHPGLLEVVWPIIWHREGTYRLSDCHTIGYPGLSNPSLQVWFRLLLVTLSPLENNNCCSSALGHLNYSEQGKLRSLIHLPSEDKFWFRCPSLKMRDQAVALSASKSGVRGAFQRECLHSTHPVTHPHTSPTIYLDWWYSC